MGTGYWLGGGLGNNDEFWYQLFLMAELVNMSGLVNMSYQTELNEMIKGSKSYVMIESLMELCGAAIDLYTKFYLVTGEPCLCQMFFSIKEIRMTVVNQL